MANLLEIFRTNLRPFKIESLGIVTEKHHILLQITYTSVFVVTDTFLQNKTIKLESEQDIQLRMLGEMC